MSQKVSRKTTVNEEKEKKQSDGPVKDMKKKMAANAEKEKQAAEKVTEKPAEKPTDKAEKHTEKTDKVEKATEKQDKNEKPEKSSDKKPEKQDKSEKPEKSTDKKPEKQTKEEQKKPEPQPEKSKADGSQEDNSAKPEKPDAKKPDPSKPKQNGRDRVHNGVSDVTLCTNGNDDVLNGTVSADSEDDDVMLVIDDNDHDELFPELTYEETSDGDCFELPTPENGPSRSFTRRSQPKDKILKLKEDAPATDRRLRSSNSPKPQDVKRPEVSKKDSPKKQEKEGLEKVEEAKEEEAKSEEKSKEGGEREVEIEVTLEVPGNDGEELRKTDTNFSKSRVKVSPYRRSMRIADQTNTSLQANYTGNNTTMEMDITESSSFMEEAALDDSSYLRGLRSIRGRSSYKPLKEITLRHVANRSVRSAASTSAVTSPISESHNRPTGTVVGRKRKPEHDDSAEPAGDAAAPHAGAGAGAGKRMRVLERLERLAEPFRRALPSAAAASARRNAEIVGINTDLPLTAPVVSTDTFDPESLKPLAPLDPLAPLVTSSEPVAVPLPVHDERDNKRCVIM